MMTEQDDLSTVVEVRIEWLDPYNGIYVPVVHVSGDIPDGLDTVKLAQFYVDAAHKAMVSANLALPTSGIQDKG